MSLMRFPLEDLVGEGILREDEFREKINHFDFAPYRNQAVLVPWDHHHTVPIWAYLIAVAKLSDVASVLSFGELCSPMIIRRNSRYHHVGKSV
jgi:hypothetical protein